MENINNTGLEQSVEIVMNPAAVSQQTVESTLYDTREAQHIVDILRSSVYRPEAVILFGSLAGGTPHSDIAAYDLLIITDEIHLTGEQAARRYLKLKMPPKHRGIGYINPYIYTKNSSRRTPIRPFSILPKRKARCCTAINDTEFRRRPAVTSARRGTMHCIISCISADWVINCWKMRANRGE